MRYLIVLLFVALYIGLGYVLNFLNLKGNLYLLIGVPLAILFQMLVSRQPLHRVWARDEATFKLSTLSILLSATFAVYPVYKIIMLLSGDKQDFALLLFYLSALVGSVGAGFTFSLITKKTAKEFLLCLLIAGGLGCGIMFLGAVARSTNENVPLHFDYIRALTSLLTYIPICFVLEEVVFRGVLDAYLHPPGTKKGWLSAFFLSALWGLWHLPTLPSDSPLIIASFGMIFNHSLIGIPLSFFWRRSGNLAVPGFTHAFIDAIRNAILRN